MVVKAERQEEAPRQQWRGLIETVEAAQVCARQPGLHVSNGVASLKQLDRDLNGHFSGRLHVSNGVASLKLCGFRGAILVDGGSTSAMAWPH